MTPTTTAAAPAGAAPRCVVPRLKGLTRAAASKRLKTAGCRLGKVRLTRFRPQGDRSGQAPPRGRDRAESGLQASLRQRRSGDPRAPEAPLDSTSHGAIAQLGERLLCKQEVRGSIPLGSTARNPWQTRGFRRYWVGSSGTPTVGLVPVGAQWVGCEAALAPRAPGGTGAALLLCGGCRTNPFLRESPERRRRLPAPTGLRQPPGTDLMPRNTEPVQPIDLCDSLHGQRVRLPVGSRPERRFAWLKSMLGGWDASLWRAGAGFRGRCWVGGGVCRAGVW